METKPYLSVVVAIVSDTTRAQVDRGELAKCLDGFRAQIDPPPFEVIVPFPSAYDSIHSLKTRYPEVKFIPVSDLQLYTGKPGSREHHNELRARGACAAAGDILAFIEDYSRPDPQWCTQVAAAHQSSQYAGIGGPVENGIDRPLNWAVFLPDFARYMQPVRAGETETISDANVSYKRASLESIRPVWQAVFEEPLVNAALRNSGGKLAMMTDAPVFHHRKNLKLSEMLRERFAWGRSYGAGLSESTGRAARWARFFLSPLMPALLFLKTFQIVRAKGRLPALVGSLPWIALLMLSWSLGEGIGLMSGKAQALEIASLKPACEENAG